MSRCRSASARVVASLGALLIGSLAAPGAVADRLHLEGGGEIVTEAWWIEGETLVYRQADGTVSLPRSLVVRIEHEAGGTPGPAPGTTPREGRPAPPPAPATVRPTPIAERLGAARQALEARDWERAAALYEGLIPDAEGLAEPRVGSAISHIALGQDRRALAIVLDGLARKPREAALLELLGDLRNREERVADAVRAWKDAFDVDPNDRLRDKILKGERELHAGRDYATDMSAHFNVRYDGELDESLAAEVTEYLEEQYWAMAETFDLAPDGPITVLLYPRQEFRDVTQSPEWVGGLYDGKIRVPLGGLRTLHPAARGLLRHELAHAFVHLKSRGQCPRWLHEGIAQILEGRTLGPAERHAIVGTLREIEPTAWDRDGVSYPMALSLTAHLAGRRDLDGLVRVLGRLGQGAALDAALESVFGTPYAALCRDWAEGTLQAGSR